MTIFHTPIPLSLYIHIPWCVKKCPYCDFNSHEIKKPIAEEAYINALFQDLDAQLFLIEKRPIISIFFGGGTPSVFSPAGIENILTGVEARLAFHQHIEITLEANPGTLDENRFQGFKNAGINRLSIGIQSLQNDKLTTLGRIHNRDHALRAIENAIKAGFDSINVDLMYGLPGQTLIEAMQDLEDALHFQLPHLSWYQLTIEPNTLFYHQRPALPVDDTIALIQSEGEKRLKAAGLYHYEVSAFAKKGFECRHNTNYWEFGDYVGLGAGAHSKITHKDHITRHSQLKHPAEYLNSASKKPLPLILQHSEIIFEFMLNALRLTAGVSMNLFQERTGIPLKTIEDILKKARDKKLLDQDPTILRPTALGRQFLNDVVEMFL